MNNVFYVCCTGRLLKGEAEAMSDGRLYLSGTHIAIHMDGKDQSIKRVFGKGYGCFIKSDHVVSCFWFTLSGVMLNGLK